MGTAAIIKLFSCSAHMSMKLIILVNVKMTRIVGLLTFTRSRLSEAVPMRPFFRAKNGGK